MKKFDVVIVGAGCAGLMSAQLLARKNISVALIDSKKDLLDLSFLTLGSFMDIKKYELSEKVIASQINKGSFYSKRFAVTKPATNVAIIDKTQLHRELLDKCIESGVSIFKDSRISDIQLSNDNAIEHVTDKRGLQYQAEIYIDATGTTGLLSKKLGLQEATFPLAVGLEYNAEYTGDPHEVIFFIGPEYAGGYGWIFPLDRQKAIVGFGSFNPNIRCNLKQGLAAIINDRRVKQQITIEDQTTYGGNIPITAVNKTLYSGNLVCIGDSVSQVNPLVGEGYKFILDSSIMAVDAITNALKQTDLSLLKDYEEGWTHTYHSDYSNSKMLQGMLAWMHQYDSLTDIGLLFLKFKRAKTVAKIISGQFDKLDLLLP